MSGPKQQASFAPRGRRRADARTVRRWRPLLRAWPSRRQGSPGIRERRGGRPSVFAADSLTPSSAEASNFLARAASISFERKTPSSPAPVTAARTPSLRRWPRTRRSWHSARPGSGTWHSRPWRAPRSVTAVTISPSSSAVSNKPVKKSSQDISRLLVITVAASPTSSQQDSRQRGPRSRSTPPIVPQLRTSGSPMPFASDARNRNRNSLPRGKQPPLRARVIAPRLTNARLHRRMPLSSSIAAEIHQARVNAARRSFRVGIRLMPPARSFDSLLGQLCCICNGSGAVIID